MHWQEVGEDVDRRWQTNQQSPREGHRIGSGGERVEGRLAGCGHPVAGSDERVKRKPYFTAKNNMEYTSMRRL